MHNFPRKFWILSAFALVVASLVLFVPYELVKEVTGLSFAVFLVTVSLVEFACAAVIMYFFMKYRRGREKRESEWTYHPDDF